MSKIKISKFSLLFVLIAVSAIILFPTHPANAGCNILTGVSGCILEGTSYFVYLVFTILGKGIAVLAGLLQKIINISIYPEGGIAVIDESWKIMRNFANMFFILALIMMAFATIFDVLPGAAKYNARALFGKFLFTALLINFSLVLGIMVIQGTQVLSNTFLTAIGDVSGKLGQGLNPSLLLPNISETTASQAIDQGIFGALIALIFAVVLAFTFAFSLLTAALFAFIRIPILWALLIISPIAWIMNIFPAGEGTFKKWWSTFIGWNMFLPIFLFFLYFGLYFLQSQDAVMQAIAAQVKDQSLNEGVPFTFQMLFMYIMAGIFLIGGTIVAMKASMFSGTGVVGVAKWGRGVAARRLGLTAAGGAAKGRLEQIKQEGLPGFGQKLYGGQAGLERQTSGWAERFGVRGAADSQLAKDVVANKKKFERITDPNELRSLMGRGRKDEQLAIRELMKDRGLLNNTELQDTYQLYGGPSTVAGQKFARSIKFDKLSAPDRESWVGKISDAETLQNIFSTMADKGDSYIMKEENLNKALDMLKLEGEQRDLLKKIEKNEFILATKLSMNRGFIKEFDPADKTMKDIRKVFTDPTMALERSLEQAIKRMSPDALLEATRTLTKEYDASEPQLGKIALGTLNQQKIETMMAKGTQSQIDSWNKIDEKGRFNEEAAKAQKEAKAKELAEITGRASGEAIARELNRGGRTPPPSRGGSNINPNNVVDLRQGERLSPGGIILTPSTQAEIEREKRNNP